MAKCIMCEIQGRENNLENGIKNIKMRYNAESIVLVKNVPIMLCDKCCEEFISREVQEKLNNASHNKKRTVIDFKEL